MRRWHGAAVALAVAAAVAGCGRNRVVGEANGQEITAEEFRLRYRKYIESTGERENILVREKVLNNMINERLIFEDVHRQGLDADSVYAGKMRVIRGQALLDAYARRMTTDTIRVSDPELMEEFRSSNTRVSARYVYAATPEDAWDLKRRLQNGESFEKLAREVFHDSTLASTGGSLGYFGYGEMERGLEQPAFSLPVGELSDPVRLRIGYAVVRVDRRVVRPLLSEYDYAKAKPVLEKAIVERKTSALLSRDTESIEAELQPRFDDAGVDAALRFMTADLQGASGMNEIPLLPDSLRGLPLVAYRTGAWSVGHFLAEAEEIRAKDRRKIRSAEALKDAAIGLLARGVLLDRAQKAGLEGDAKVEEQVQFVREDFLLRRWKSSILDTLGSRAFWDEDTLRARFAAAKDQYHVPPAVNVAQIIVVEEQVAAGLAARLRRGADFAVLARKYSVHRPSAEKGGELGFGPRDAYGILAEKFFGAPRGRIIGPEHLDGFYGVFKVLAKREGRPEEFGEARNDVIAALLPARQQAALANAITSLRMRGRVRVDREELSAVDISTN
jgi:parvulin-like peptidyl-prolyl isomerase